MKISHSSISVASVIAAFVLIALLIQPVSVLSHGNDNIQERAAELLGLTEERLADSTTALDQRRQQSTASSVEARVEACESDKPRLASLMDEHSERALGEVYAYDAVLLEINDYTIESGLAVSLVDDFAHEAANAQAVAQVEAGALGILNTEIDCSDPDVAAAVGAFRETAEGTKAALEAYRQKLLELISTITGVSNTAQDDSLDNLMQAVSALNPAQSNLSAGDWR